MAADALKAGIARYVTSALCGLATKEGDEDESTLALANLSGLGIKSIGVQRVGTLEAVIRVRTEHQGVRYFAVRVSEPI